jgi:hypothetical protein
MGELNPTQRVVDVIKKIDQHLYQLPSIQRPFVWDEEQILKLIDSLICSYPIGAIMVWKPVEKIRCRSFMDTYDAGDHMLSKLPPTAERKAHMVLDGQQRLQAIYLGFKGLYNNERVYLRIDDYADENESNLNYRLDFLSDADAEANPAWVQLSELASLSVPKIIHFVRERLPDSSEEVQDKAVEIVSMFVQEMAMDESLLFQEVDEGMDYNQVLEVFERVNSGGTKLSKSDLLFSTVKLKIPNMEERFLSIIDDLNDSDRHNFTTDFIIKTAFVVLDKKAKYDFKKLRDGKFLTKLGDEFDHLEKVITSMRVWLDGKALIKAGRFLRSQLALIPLIDYLILNKKYLGPAEGKETILMRQYLYMAFFARLYSRAPDSVLDQLHDILVKAHKDMPGQFPIKEIGEFIARREKKSSFSFREEYLWDLDLVLNIIDGGVLQIPKQRTWSLERDHIFPQQELKNRKITKDVDDVGNLRFLGKSRNISKSDTMPNKNTEFFGKDDPILGKLYKRACNNLTQESFSAFVNHRRKLIEEKVTVFLGMAE